MKKIYQKNVRFILKRAILVVVCCVLVTTLIPNSVFAVSKVNKTTIKKIKTKSSSSITVKWKKVSGIKGYVIYQKKGNEKYKIIKTITKPNTTSYTVKGLKSETKYSYRIKTYSMKNGKKVYSAFSNEKRAKTYLKPSKAKNKLIKYINKNYEKINDYGEKGFGEIEYLSNSEIVYTIFYDEITEEFTFYFNWVLSTAASTLILELDKNNHKNAFVTDGLSFYDVNMGYISYVLLDIPSYNNTNLYFTIDSAQNMYETEIQEMSNEDLQFAMLVWEDLLENYVGISLKDLGFISL